MVMEHLASVLPPGVSSSGRRADAVVVNTTVDADAVEMLWRYTSPGHTGMGKFLVQFFVPAS